MDPLLGISDCDRAKLTKARYENTPRLTRQIPSCIRTVEYSFAIDIAFYDVSNFEPIAVSIDDTTHNIKDIV